MKRTAFNSVNGAGSFVVHNSETAFGVRVYAYCLMIIYVHLLLSAGEAVAGISRMIKALAARAT